ncbi:hypothetical protein [Kineococcus sp. SYSU DK018]
MAVECGDVGGRSACEVALLEDAWVIAVLRQWLAIGISARRRLLVITR